MGSVRHGIRGATARRSGGRATGVLGAGLRRAGLRGTRLRRTGFGRTGFRRAGALLVVLGLGAGTAGCGTDTGSGTKVTLTVVAANYGDSVHKNSQGYWDRVALAFHAANPGVDVVAKVYPADQVDAKVAALVKQGKAPDIVQTGSYAQYAADGLLYDAEDLLSIRTQASFVPSLADAGKVGHEEYGLPFTASTRLMFYNKTLFRRAGLTPPKTWQQLLVDARVLKAQGVTYPIALPLGPQEAEAETLLWLLAGDGGYTGDTGAYSLDSAANVSTLQWLKSTLVAEGLTGPVAPAKLNLDKALEAFTNGDAAMVDAPLSLMRQIADSADSVSYGTVPLPGRDGRAVPTMGTADWILGFKQRGHRTQIGRFLDFLYRDKYVREQATEYQLLPVTTSVSDAMRANPDYKALWGGLDSLQNMRLYPLSETNWSEVATAIRRRIGAAVAPGGDPRTVLESIEKTARGR
ncbi:hypothetical protein OK074_0480 [Actinobacteria bacterium OK074]|nr:hypothetical protein OK074_0480 [Actinobacteria bacterium OK074]